jgi:hypothetical protein
MMMMRMMMMMMMMMTIIIIIIIIIIHQCLVLRPGRVPTKAGVNRKHVNQKLYSHKK